MKKIVGISFICIFLFACNSTNKSNPEKKRFNIKELFKKLKTEKQVLTTTDSSNIFDNTNFDPSKDSLAIQDASSEFIRDSMLIEKLHIDSAKILTKPSIIDSTLQVKKQNQDIRNITDEEIQALKFNLEQLVVQVDTATIIRKRKEARIWLEISKASQHLYLHIDGELIDSFKVSTGLKKYETPLFDKQPSGPQFTKYSSKKYPGGNYNGLGNMPYVIFIQGGYAIHGTTVGNFKKLGYKASHGCIRLHSDNAKIVFELVKTAGIKNTWITVRE
jgi:lipoprotein-anchoring transpeptidase ErfK/SrfK